MGGRLSVVSSDYGQSNECMEYLKKELWLTVNEINRFYAIFRQIHKANPRYEYLITAHGLLDYFDIDSNVIHKLIFGWLTTESPLTFSFVEFVIVICCFLTLREKDFGKFLFVLFDVNHDNILEFSEVRDLLGLIKKEDKASNGPVLNILAKMKMDTMNSPTFDGSLSMSKFIALFNKHTSLSHPFRQLKCDLRRKCIGETYWHSKERLKVKHMEEELREKEMSEMVNEDDAEERASKYIYCDPARYPLMAEAVRKMLANMSATGQSRFHLSEWSQKAAAVAAEAAGTGGKGSPLHVDTSSRHTFPAVQKPSPSPGKRRSSTARGRGEDDKKQREKKRDDEDGVLPTIPALAHEASLRSRTGFIRRQGSNDDMLDSTGKPHKLPSFKRGGSNRGMMTKDASNSSLDGGRRSRQASGINLHAGDDCKIARIGSTRAMRNSGTSARGGQLVSGASARGSQLAPLPSSRKLVRRHSSDDMLR